MDAMYEMVLSILGIILVSHIGLWYKLGRVETKLDAHCKDVPHKE